MAENQKNLPREVYKDTALKIDGNTMSFNENMIQISNISHAWRSEEPKDFSAILTAIICIVIGLLIINFIALIGLILLVVAGLNIFNYMKDSVKYLINIELNAQRIYSFSSPNEQFIAEVFAALTSAMAHGARNVTKTYDFSTSQTYDFSSKQINKNKQRVKIGRGAYVKGFNTTTNDNSTRQNSVNGSNIMANDNSTHHNETYQNNENQ